FSAGAPTSMSPSAASTAPPTATRVLRPAFRSTSPTRARATQNARATGSASRPGRRLPVALVRIALFLAPVASSMPQCPHTARRKHWESKAMAKGHATHFLERLERLEPADLELALGLYRDAPLVKSVLL